MVPSPAMAEENFELSDLGAAAISKIGRVDMSAPPQCAIVPATSSSAEGAASEEDLGFWSQLQEIADNARSSPSEEAEGSSSSSSSATESDSIGGGRRVTTTGAISKNAIKPGGGDVFYPAAKGAIRGLSLPPQHQQQFLNARQQQSRCPSLPPSAPEHLKQQQQQQQQLASYTMEATGERYQRAASASSKPSPPGSLDMGYHTLLHSEQQQQQQHQEQANSSSRATPTSSLNGGGSTSDVWDVRATRTPIADLHILTHNAKHLPVSTRTLQHQQLHQQQQKQQHSRQVESNHVGPGLDSLPDPVLLRILSNLRSDQLVRCARVSRRFYFLAWDPALWHHVSLEGAGATVDADLALKTIVRLLSRNASRLGDTVESLRLGGCPRLTDRGLAIVARRCPNLRRLEVQGCSGVTNGGLMDLVTKCQALNHLDVSGCSMISTIAVHQPPSLPPNATGTSPRPTSSRHRLSAASPSPSSGPQFRRLLPNLQFLDLTDCVSLEDSGVKMVVETCPQLLYLFMRRCSNITDVGLKYVASYCLSLRELSFSDCSRVTDFGLYELAKLGPNLRYLSVAKCDQISDSGVKQIAKLCYKLRYLNVRGCEAVSDDAIETLSRSCSRLRSLDIGKCDVTDVGLKLLSEHCPNLKKLSVKSCEMVSDRGIQCVAYYCRGLQQLNIQDCPITLEGYRTVKKFCRRCIIEHTNPGFY